jgi:hypothetical protein
MTTMQDATSGALSTNQGLRNHPLQLGPQLGLTLALPLHCAHANPVRIKPCVYCVQPVNKRLLLYTV